MSNTNKENMSETDMMLALHGNDDNGTLEALERNLTRDVLTGRIVASRDGLQNNHNTVHFTTEKVLHKLNTYLADGVPQYVDMDFITIRCPGSKDLIHRPVTAMDQWAYPNEYEAFKSGLTLTQAGTPLGEWPELTVTQIKELMQVGVQTIEQLVSLPESTARVLPGFHGTKSRAKQFLDQRTLEKANSAVADALAKQESKHKSEMDELKAKMDQLLALVGNQTKAKKEAPPTDK